MAAFSRSHCARSVVGLRLQVGQLLLELRQPVPGGGVGLLAQRLALDLELHDPAGDLVQLGRHRVDLGAQPGRRLVDEVDGLVGQEAVGDVAVRQHRRRHQGGVLDAHAVVHLVALLAARAGSRWCPRPSAGRPCTGWKRRSSAASFSMCLRYSSSVVAPMQCSSPRASIGLSRLPASIAPSAAPAPTTVCSSSMKRMISPCDSCTSLSTALSRSSNSPRYLAPAISAPMSSATMRLSLSPSGTSPRTMRWASPSTIAVLPTPGSPISTGLFLVRRERTWMTRRISSSRPMTGSSLPCWASVGEVAAVLLERLVGALRAWGSSRAGCRARPRSPPAACRA